MEIYNNIKTLVRKYPIPVILNIMGLVLAFTAFIMIMAYVRFEWNFDRCYPCEAYLTVTEADGNREVYKHKVNLVSPDFFDVFGIEVLEGSRDALLKPN